MRTRPKARQHWRSAVLEALDKLKTCIKALSLTGDRRFPVIALPEGWQIPLERLRAERDSIWAAAMALYRAGVQSHLTRSEEAAIADRIGIEPQHRDKNSDERIGSVLRSLGWRSDPTAPTQRVNGRVERPWRLVAPPDAAAALPIEPIVSPPDPTAAAIAGAIVQAWEGAPPPHRAGVLAEAIAAGLPGELDALRAIAARAAPAAAV